MDSRDVLLAACDLVVRLSVTKDDGLLCEPASRLTPEIREAIRAHREDLRYDVHLSNALRYVMVERYVEGADVGSVLAAHDDAINAAYLAKAWPAYRKAVRGYVEAGPREIERAKRAIEDAEAPAARGEAQRDALRAGRDRRASGSGPRVPDAGNAGPGSPPGRGPRRGIRL